jgi:hypothetical protein
MWALYLLGGDSPRWEKQAMSEAQDSKGAMPPENPKLRITHPGALHNFRVRLTPWQPMV